MTEGESLNTSKGMPLVTDKTVKSIFESHTNGPDNWGNHLEDVKKRMLEEQPNLTKFIEGQVGKFPPELHQTLFEIATATYAVLEQQANANKMSTTFSLPAEEKG